MRFLRYKREFGHCSLMTDLEILDLGMRMLIFGQFSIVIAAVLLAMRNRFGTWLIILSLGILSYLYISSEPLVEWLSTMYVPCYLFALSMPWIFWFFVREGFELQLATPWIWCSWLLLVLPKWMMFIYFQDQWADLQLLQRAVKQLAGIAVVVHALYHLLRGYGDDLVEKRRWLRKALGVCTGVTILVVMAVELGLDFETQVASLSIFASGTIAALTLLFAPAILSFGHEMFSDSSEPVVPGLEPAGGSPRSQAQQQVQTRLNEAMREGAYRDSGLTIGRLAELLQIQEHQLRKLINKELGYRNFSAFLQHYRIAEVCRHLKDPNKARIPILTLALEAGFGSLGPFNRAFKHITGQTPSKYREKPVADTEKL